MGEKEVYMENALEFATHGNSNEVQNLTSLLKFYWGFSNDLHRVQIAALFVLGRGWCWRIPCGSRLGKQLKLG